MELATGIDLVEIERIEQSVSRYGQRFLERIFTPLELAQANGRPASLAARFAAKEAVAKALGTGIGAVTWQEIEVRKTEAGKPELALSGCAARLAAEQGLSGWSVSISHTRTCAVAVVIAMKN